MTDDSSVDLPLDEQIWAEPYRFGFFAALRLLERYVADRQGATDELPSPENYIRFRGHTSLSFPASEIWELQRLDDSSQRVEVTVAFFGLTGANGALPRPYSELLIERIRKGDFALRDFLDLLNHHLLRLFAGSGTKYRVYLNYERAQLAERRRMAQGSRKLRGFLLEERARIDHFSQVLLEAAGLGPPLLRYRDTVRNDPAPRLGLADQLFRYFSGHFARQQRSAVSLAQMVSGYFHVDAEIVQFVGQWLMLPQEYQSCLPGLALAGDGRPAPRLGQNTVIGSRVFEVQGKFRVRLGPLTFSEFCDYLPNGTAFRQLSQLVRLYAGATFDFDIQPTLRGSDVPWCQLGGGGAAAPRLGWNTWLRNQEFSNAVDDAVFDVPDSVSLGN